ncbi:hypothetical protein E2320_016450 [Naja naja]|nr:hypothetical protein E2320_016450 [Naja naja]
MKALVLAVLFLFIAANEAKVYSKCELASILKRNGMDRYYGYSLGNWICMAYYESRYNSRAVGPRNWDGSRDYGIFQINSRWWCNNYQGRTANGCKKPCSAFTNDDITDDIICAKRIGCLEKILQRKKSVTMDQWLPALSFMILHFSSSTCDDNDIIPYITTLSSLILDLHSTYWNE